MRGLTAFVLLCLTFWTQAAEIPVVALPGGGYAYKEVESIRERRFRSLIPQKTDFSCGAASLATILHQAYSLQVTEQMVIEGMLSHADPETVRTKGFSMLDMKRYVESIGLRARGYRVSDAQFRRLQMPVIVLLDVRGYKHFVVMQRTRNDWVYIGDPILGHKRYAFEDFKKGWNGIVLAIVGPGYDRTNVLLSPPDPLTARDRMNAFQPLQDAQLMEFGFIQSDFF
ncbi:C39 family peptidase [Pseudomonas schmalbachii]|uniref:C39 family peptidase n=1 Tax=Pseudomonas schmalbachii TaxID=2816993 RepID=A0ABS3TJD9_9PSED|nr:C39 family peptidase [Pseudomonas schmalbachii]MBO3273760.1 C39 family peptidase [Pseudomonas schmalbachii]